MVTWSSAPCEPPLELAQMTRARQSSVESIGEADGTKMGERWTGVRRSAKGIWEQARHGKKEKREGAVRLNFHAWLLLDMCLR
jgi:hypothetical protein